MKRCPVCNSRKFHGSKLVGWKCYRCGFENNPLKARESMHKANNGGGTVILQKPSITSVNSSNFVDLHNNGYKFKIIKDAKVDWPIQEGFRGGGKQDTVYKGCKVSKTKNWLIIYKDKRMKVPLKDLAKVSSSILEGMKALALEIATKYGFEIDTIPIFFKNRPEVKLGFVSAINFVEDEVKAVYKPPPSPIETQGSNAVPNAINLTQALSELNRSIQLEIQNKQLHQNVLENMSLTLKAIQNNVSKPQGFAVKIRRFFGFWLAKVKSKTISLKLFRKVSSKEGGNQSEEKS